MAEERVRRRLAAILAADVVGYSRMMGQDDVVSLWELKRSLSSRREFEWKKALCKGRAKIWYSVAMIR